MGTSGRSHQYQAAHNQAVRFSTAAGNTWYVIRTAGGYVLATTRPKPTDTVLETHNPREAA